MTLHNWWQRLLARAVYFKAMTHRYLGNAYGMDWHYDDAIDGLTQAIARDPAFAQAYLDRGILYWREKDHPRRAIHDLTTAYELDPTLIEARFNRGVAHQQLREYREAVAEYEAYLEEGTHPYWREYAESMLEELQEWISDA